MGFYCPSCEIWYDMRTEDPFSGTNHEAPKRFCDECEKYLIGYIKTQKLWKKEIKAGRATAPSICPFCNNTGKLQDGSECPHQND